MDETKDFVMYFGYASMANPTSLQRRKMLPSASQPAVLRGFRLAFQLGGMANIVPDPDSSCHGILHRISPAMFAALHALETNYDVAEVEVLPYMPFPHNSSISGNGSGNSQVSSSMHASLSGSSSSINSCCVGTDDPCSTTNGTQLLPPVTAKTFIVPQEHLQQLQLEHPEWQAALPSERYVMIITAGLKHYGADPAWVDAVAATPFAPSRSREHYLQVPPPADPSSLRTYTVQELAAYEGKIENAKAIYAIGPKVIEVDLSAKPDGPFTQIIRSHMTGRDHTFGLCMNLYEPRLPPLQKPEDVTAEHIAWAEDMCMEWTSKHNYKVTQIGWLVKPSGVERDDVATVQQQQQQQPV